jgi:hypothetical protein
MCEVRFKGKMVKNKKKLSIMVNNEKKWTATNPIWCRMKKRNPSSGQDNQLMHCWLLVHLDPYVKGRIILSPLDILYMIVLNKRKCHCRIE